MLDAAFGQSESYHALPLWAAGLFFAYIFYKTIKDGRDEEKERLRRSEEDRRIAEDTRRFLED